MTINLDQILTRDEVADKLKVTRAYLDSAAVRGKGPPFLRVGRAIRYDQSQVEAWLAAQTYTPPCKRRAA
jgi:excisionase family DNA binding protein